MNDDLPADLDPIADFFGLNDTPPVAKVFHVVRAIAAIAALDAAPFALIFGGGTALARACPSATLMSSEIGALGDAFPGEILDAFGLATPAAIRHPVASGRV